MGQSGEPSNRGLNIDSGIPILCMNSAKSTDSFSRIKTKIYKELVLTTFPKREISHDPVWNSRDASSPHRVPLARSEWCMRARVARLQASVFSKTAMFFFCSSRIPTQTVL